MKKILLLLLVFTASVSCSERTLYERLDGQFKGCGDTVTVRMVDIFPMQWDTMYVLNPFHYARPQSQESQDIARRILLVKEGTVVYMEDEVAVSEPYSVEFHAENFRFTPESAIFRAVKAVKVIKNNTQKKHIIVLLPVVTDTL